MTYHTLLKRSLYAFVAITPYASVKLIKKCMENIREIHKHMDFVWKIRNTERDIFSRAFLIGKVPAPSFREKKMRAGWVTDIVVGLKYCRNNRSFI